MEANHARPQNIIETTDALEAVSACQTMKNFLFTLILIGLVICQILFWMDRFHLIGPQRDGVEVFASGVRFGNPFGLPVLLAATTDVSSERQSSPAEATDEARSIEKTIDEIVQTANQPRLEEEIVLEKQQSSEATRPSVQTEDESADSEPSEAGKSDFRPLSVFRISTPFAAGVVAVCNFVIIAFGILYCLSLLMCLKISLAGRLGGINHITRAFFLSLFLLVIVMPWQVVLPKVLLGAVWLPDELFGGGWDKADASVFWKVMLYLRFCGLWFAAVWFLLWTQMRSGKWARATLRRLGVVR